MPATSMSKKLSGKTLSDQAKQKRQGLFQQETAKAIKPQCREILPVSVGRDLHLGTACKP